MKTIITKAVNIINNRVKEELDITREVEIDELYHIIDKEITEFVNMNKEYATKDYRIPISVATRLQIRREVYNSIRGYGVLSELMEDDTISEIMINGYQNIFYEKDGLIHRWNRHIESKEKLEDIAQRIAALSNRLVNESTPIVDTRLADGSRVNIVLSPIAIDGPVITIRKFFHNPLTMDNLIEYNSITSQAADYLKELVEARYNIFVSGGTGSGKTTFLNVLSNYIPTEQRVITIEDSAELQLTNIDNLVRLEARNANIEGKNAIKIKELIKSSLRMRPDRIVVGEVRGEEALDMLAAMNTGHDGSLSTGHGNSPQDMVNRLETMVLTGIDMPLPAVRGQIISAIDIIVHLARTGDHSRKIMEICEIDKSSQDRLKTNTLFRYDYQSNRLEKTGELINTDKLIMYGKRKES